MIYAHKGADEEKKQGSIKISIPIEEAA